MSRPLAEKIEVLRDEVLETARRGDGKPPGAEIFDAVVSRVAAGEEGDLDLSLRDAIARRLAWGESEDDILASSSEVCERVLAACERALTEPERLRASEAVAEIGAAAARAVALAALGRAGRDRAELLRVKRARRRLEEARSYQAEEIRDLEAAVARARGETGEGEGGR